MINNKKIKYYYCLFFFLFLLFPTRRTLALPIGTLLYRTSDNGMMYGYNSPELIVSQGGLIKHIYSGHVGIYVGREDGVDYIVEALGGGIVKTPANQFINEAVGEKLIGARFPIKASLAQAEQAALIAKALASAQLDYDFDFKDQKGPSSGQWTCVGLTEKVYESAGISNPGNFGALEYNPDYYSIDITPDGYDNYSLYNSQGDCFSRDREFSKISKKSDMILPFPELIGFAAGKEYKNERYIFLPLTQFLQPSLKSVFVDIELSSSFVDEEVRGKTAVWPLVLKWSLINNPVSSLKKIASAIWPPADSGPKLKYSLVVEEPESKEASFQEIDQSISFVEPELIAEEELASVSEESFLEIIKDEEMAIKQKTSSGSIAKNSKEDNKDENEQGVGNTVVKKESDVKNVSNTTKNKQEVIKPEKFVAPPNLAPPSPPEVKAVASTKVVAATATSSASSSYVKPANNYSLSVASSSVLSSQAESNATSSEDFLSGIDPDLILAPGHLVISRVGEAGEDDWLELFNPFPVEFDLADQGYRLERAKTANDPSIMLRFGNPDDGDFKTTVIAPYGRYLVTRQEASASLRQEAQAISSRSEFSWLSGKYSLYLGKGPISSPSDPDIIDYLGFGEAVYFEGSGPAPAFSEGYYLSRKALASSTLVSMLEDGAHNLLNLVYDSDDNSYDWLLLPNSGQLEEEENDNDNDIQNENNSEAGLDSPGLLYLNHFDQCYSEGQSFVVGRWGCGQVFNYNNPSFEESLSKDLPGESFSIIFSYRSLDDFPRVFLRLSSSVGDDTIQMTLENDMSRIIGLPGIPFESHDHNWHPDKEWQEIILTVNATASFWALYHNGQEIYHYELSSPLSDFDHITIGGDNGRVAIDELAIFDRSLPVSEISLISSANLPFFPAAPSWPFMPAELIHFYGFDEGTGSIVHDSVGVDNLNIDYDFWHNDGLIGSYISQDQRQVLIGGPLEGLGSSDFSLSFWWRNRAYPNEGRLRLGLNHGTKKMFSLIASHYRPAYFFNGVYSIFEEGDGKIIPYDDLWHHLVLAYSAHDYRLDFYVDGELKMSRPHIWILEGEEPNSLEIFQENNFYDLDELGIWRGTLRADEVASIYETRE